MFLVKCGIRLIRAQYMSSKAGESLEKFDTLTLTRDLVSENNLNSSFLFDIGIYALAYKDSGSSKVSV